MEECLHNFETLMDKIEQGSLEETTDFSDRESDLRVVEGDPNMVPEDDSDLNYDFIQSSEDEDDGE